MFQQICWKKSNIYFFNILLKILKQYLMLSKYLWYDAVKLIILLVNKSFIELLCWSLTTRSQIKFDENIFEIQGAI